MVLKTEKKRALKLLETVDDEIRMLESELRNNE